MNARGAAVRGLLWAAVLLVGTVRVAWAQAPPEAIEYYARDAVGSVRIVFDAQGNVLGRSDYLPFGETWNQSGALPRQRFTGQARDGEAGLDDFNARAYQPLFGRFTRPDPVSGSLFAPQSWNAYAYVQNRPLVATDPSGKMEAGIFVVMQELFDVLVQVGRPDVYESRYGPPDGTADSTYASAQLAYYAFINEFGGGGGIGVGGPLRPSTGDGDVVVGDTGGLNGNGNQTDQGSGNPPSFLPSRPFTQPYGSADEAAKAGLEAVNPISIFVNREYCFAVCYGPSGYFNTWPVPNLAKSDSCPKQGCPLYSKFVGGAHTHGADGQDYFSVDDVSSSEYSYLGTAWGYWKHDPFKAVPASLSIQGQIRLQTVPLR